MIPQDLPAVPAPEPPPSIAAQAKEWALFVTQMAGVRLILSICIMVILGLCASLVMSLVGKVPVVREYFELVGKCVELFVFGTTLFVVGRFIERREPRHFGFPRKTMLRDTIGGFALGFALISLTVLVFAVMGWYHPSLAPLWEAPGRALSGFAYAVLLMGLVAMGEEILFRGIIFRILEEGLGTLIAVALSGVLFGFTHIGNPGATILSSVLIAIEAGLLLAALYMYTRSIWAAFGVHWAWNLVLGSFYGLPVSGRPETSLVTATVDGPVLLTGGDFGPEAGVVAAFWCTLAGVILFVLAVRRGESYTPIWLQWLDGRRPGNFAPANFVEADLASERQASETPETSTLPGVS